MTRSSGFILRIDPVGKGGITQDGDSFVEDLIRGCSSIYLASNDFQGTQAVMCHVCIQGLTIKGKRIRNLKILMAKEGIIPGILIFIAFPPCSEVGFLSVQPVNIIDLNATSVSHIILDRITVSCIAAEEFEFIRIFPKNILRIRAG